MELKASKKRARSARRTRFVPLAYTTSYMSMTCSSSALSLIAPTYAMHATDCLSWSPLVAPAVRHPIASGHGAPCPLAGWRMARRRAWASSARRSIQGSRGARNRPAPSAHPRLRMGGPTIADPASIAPCAPPSRAPPPCALCERDGGTYVGGHGGRLRAAGRHRASGAARRRRRDNQGRSRSGARRAHRLAGHLSYSRGTT